MTREGQAHISTSPVITSTSPFLRPSSLRLGRFAVVEDEARVAFQRVEHGVVGEDEGRADEGAGPVVRALEAARVEEDQVLAGLRRKMIAIGCMEIADMVRRI